MPEPSTPVEATPQLVFLSRGDRDSAAVLSGAETVATIGPGGSGARSFDALDAHGAPLCSGALRETFSRMWDARDPAGRFMVSLRRATFSTSRRVEFADGARAELRRIVRGQWQLVDAHNRVTVTGQPADDKHRGGIAVDLYDGAPDLAVVVAIVELDRRIFRANERAAAYG